MSQNTSIKPAWIGVDWGTTNLRAYAMTEQGELLDECCSEQGMSSLEPCAYEAALRSLIAHWDLPNPCTIVACGMVGSRQGWQEAPYRAVPCTAGTDSPVRVNHSGNDLNVWLIPGVKQNDPADVMRGEETQIAGFLALNDDWDGVICLPGTHSKWVHVSAGEIVSFRTFMTGEVFQAISTQTVLKHSLSGEDWDHAAFETALSDTLSRPENLGSTLFSLRASDLLHGQSSGTARARLSGCLIGAELAAAKPYWLGQRIAIIGNDRLCDLYSFSLSQQGIQAERSEAGAITRAGLVAAYLSL
ncbi:2-dehydro-3-deoxygalactonokinase [Planktotalea sp.]|uniref:2-dehydro-3-deoxygalactonokinase n=1 Tax=Planktotalea sp. TaxID=2029877 RepID=UPI003D6C5174